MSAVDRTTCEPVTADLFEVTARRGRAKDLANIARVRGLDLPSVGRASFSTTHVVLSVRPDRWLVVAPAKEPGETASQWKRAFGPLASVVDQSSGHAIFDLTGSTVRDVLSRSCRIDLHASIFFIGRSAATVMAQVQTIIVRHPAGFLVLTPSSTGRHFREWFLHVAASIAPLSSGESAP